MPTPIRRRTRARELALQFLYSVEIRGSEAMEDLPSFIEHHTKGGGSSKDRAEIADYLGQICQGVYDHYSDINEWIEAIARNWRLERMALIDRNVLRIALYELLYNSTEVPFKVVINEAIDIAKRYSTPQSGSFVNGILDRARILIDELRTEEGEVPNPPAAGFGESAAPNDLDLLYQVEDDNTETQVTKMTQEVAPQPTHSGGTPIKPELESPASDDTVVFEAPPETIEEDTPVALPRRRRRRRPDQA